MIYAKKTFLLLVLASLVFTSIVTTGPLAAQTNRLPIALNELCVFPQSAPFDSQFIEIGNPNPFPVDISDYTLENIDVSRIPTTIFTIPDGTNLPANSVLAFANPQTNIILGENNRIELRDSTSTLEDSYTYDISDDEIESPNCYGRLQDSSGEWFICSTPTPGESNVAGECQEALAVSLTQSNTSDNTHQAEFVMLLVLMGGTFGLLLQRRKVRTRM